MNPLIIAVDAMGGDLGPQIVAEGAKLALSDYPELKIILVGDENILRPLVADTPDKITIHHAASVISTHESPTTALRQKKDSSIVVGLGLLKENSASGFVSSGSTGALLAGATLIVGRKAGIERPALGVLLPTATGQTLLIDSGANMDAKPSYLLQFGEMGADYVRRALKIENPRVGLLNVGVEKEKGNAAAKEAYDLLEASELNFIGNIEARELPAGAMDVAVCDGFVGNIVLKFMEGFAHFMNSTIKQELMASPVSKVGALMSKGAFARVKKRVDPREVGGAPFLGCKKLVIKAHGNSDALAIKNAIRQCVIYES